MAVCQQMVKCDCQHTEILRDSLEAEVDLNTPLRDTKLLGVKPPCLEVPVIDHVCSHTQ